MPRLLLGIRIIIFAIGGLAFALVQKYLATTFVVVALGYQLWYYRSAKKEDSVPAENSPEPAGAFGFLLTILGSVLIVIAVILFLRIRESGP